MKRSLALLAGSLLLIMSCNKSGSKTEDSPADDVLATQRHCAAADVLADQLKADPALGQRLQEIEDFTQRVVAHPEQFRLVNGIVEIPVVFNVLYRTAAQNVSLPSYNHRLMY